MKIRNGFVSNSSSSSFVVQVKEFSYLLKKPIYFIDKFQEDVLKCLGFNYVEEFPRNALMSLFKNTSFVKRESSKENFPLCMKLDTLDDGDEILYELFKNHIPFYASQHYDEWFYVYDGKSDFYEVFPNYVFQYPFESVEKRKNFVKDEVNFNVYKKIFFELKDGNIEYTHKETFELVKKDEEC